jgi:hypothetical protein
MSTGGGVSAPSDDASSLLKKPGPDLSHKT